MSSGRVHAQDGITAAFGLAVRMTGSRADAAAIVERSAAAVGVEPGPLVQTVRRAARLVPRRSDPISVERPGDLHEIALGDWAVVERVALRGMTISEAASDTGLPRSEVALRLRRGMIAARDAFGSRQAADHPQPARLAALGGDAARRRSRRSAAPP